MQHEFEDSTHEPTSNPLGDINARFHKLYRQQKDKALRSINNGDIMLICRMDNRLIVKTGPGEQAFTINTTRYHNLKAMSHATLAIYYSLLHATDKKALTQAKNWVNQIRQQEPVELGVQLADITADLLDTVQTTATLSHTVMSQYQLALEPIYAKLMVEAANDEIDSLVKRLQSIGSEHNYPSSKTFMVVCGGHQPRYKALASLIFKRWFKGLQDHIVNYKHHVRYCEGGTCLDDAIALVATAIVDRELAKSMLGSSEALNQDVIGIVAKKAINTYWRENGLR